VVLQDLYDQIVNKRDLKLEVMINPVTKCYYKALCMNYRQFTKSQADNRAKKSISLETCLKAFSQEEMLSGNDQWYCNKCKEHRDIHKKLEIYKIPPILMIQLKRFTSKKGAANSGKSGFFNLAYA
jgi:ubiquitin C-terminal hydrolase